MAGRIMRSPLIRSTDLHRGAFSNRAAEIGNVAGGLRSGKSQHQLGDPGTTVERRAGEAFLGRAGDRKGVDEAIVEYPLRRAARAPPRARPAADPLSGPRRP